MAIDTQNKRASAANLFLFIVPPAPDGTVDASDRSHLDLYAGITTSEELLVIPDPSGALVTLFAADMSVFFSADEFAETLSYTATGGLAADITAQVVRAHPFQEPYVRGENTAHAEIYVKKSQVANPQFGDLYYFDSQYWEMDPSRGVIYEDDNVYRIGLERRMS